MICTLNAQVQKGNHTILAATAIIDMIIYEQARLKIVGSCDEATDARFELKCVLWRHSNIKQETDNNKLRNVSYRGLEHTHQQTKTTPRGV